MSKEDINSANGCNEVGMSDANVRSNVEDLNGAKSEHSMLSLVFEKS